MSGHTPGRLVVRGGYSIYADDGKTPVADACLTNSVADKDEANARRLVACWNACEGISTDELETTGGAAVGWTRTASKLIHATTQRGELLEALNGLLHEVGFGRIVLDTTASTKARAAIAKVES